jgi:SSS family solute:Na+ symporter
MTTLDWIIVWAPLVLVLALAVYTSRFNKSVADFIAAGRCAGRYLLTSARGAPAGAIYTIAIFEITSKAGFTFSWWSLLTPPITLVVATTGFVYYRYRETRALTVAQFLEIRYSRAFRLFMGGLAFLAGLLNYGIFPAVSARFFVYFLALPQTTHLLFFTMPTWQLVAIADLSCALFLILTGGQISILLTDCVEGLFSQVGYLIIIVALVMMFSWHQVLTVMAAAPPGASMLDPFDTQNAKDYNIWFVLIGLVTGIYGTMAWQNSHGFNSAALTPHESRMSLVLAQWRGFAGVVLRYILVISTITFLAHPAFAAQAAPVKAVIAGIHSQEIHDQMSVPITLSYILPMGIKGLFCSVILLGVLAGDAAAMHSWGSIFIQDVVLPLQKKPMTQKRHMTYLRLSISGVALFAFIFSSLFSQTQNIILFWTITGAVFVSGAGSVIIGGLYWKKGTTAGAWSAAITGSFLALMVIVLQQYYPHFPIHSQYLSLMIACIGVATYVTVSLLTGREDFNMDKMLHRGKYAIAGEHLAPIRPFWERFHPINMLGIDKEYSFWDRVITLGLFGWMIFWFLVFITGCIWHVIKPWPLGWWENFWLINGIILPFILGVLTTIWFTIGSIHDMRIFFRALRVEKRDAHDDGTVVHAAKP